MQKPGTVSGLMWLTVVAVTLAASASGAVAAAPGIYVSFNANHTFSVTLVDGTTVGTSGTPSTLPAGTYQLYLNDTSGALMQFDLSGPGVSLVTNMTNAEDLAASYTEAFQPSSTYTYRDDDAAGSPVFTFTTSATVASSPTATTSSPTPVGGTSVGTTGTTDIVGSKAAAGPRNPGTLTATVTSAGKLELGSKGRSVTELQTGRYTLSVVDRSRTAGFTLQSAKSSPHALSGARFSGRRTLTLDLTPGQWFFYATAISKKSYFVVTK
jgi:hypothetical protein